MGRHPLAPSFGLHRSRREHPGDVPQILDFSRTLKIDLGYRPLDQVAFDQGSAQGLSHPLDGLGGPVGILGEKQFSFLRHALQCEE